MSSNLSVSDMLNYALEDCTGQCDNDIHILWTAMELFPINIAPSDDTVHVKSFEDDDWDPLAPFPTPQQ